jgi:hypothetical protein
MDAKHTTLSIFSPLMYQCRVFTSKVLHSFHALVHKPFHGVVFGVVALPPSLGKHSNGAGPHWKKWKWFHRLFSIVRGAQVLCFTLFVLFFTVCWHGFSCH